MRPDAAPPENDEYSPPPAAPAPRAKSYSRARRGNHWSHRPPEEFVDYPRLRPLGYIEEIRLIEKAKAGDIAARNRVWMHYARLTLAVVNHFRIPDHLMADAIQEGAIGVKRAIEKFDVGRFNSFSTYAWPWIYQCVQRFLSNNANTVRVPVHLLTPYRRFRRELRGSAGTADETALLWTIAAGDRRLYQQLVRVHAVALLLPVDEVDPEDHPTFSEEPTHDVPDWAGICRTGLGMLHERQRVILQKRYGLDGGSPMSLREVGAYLHLTKERVRQIQLDAEGRLRHRLAGLRYLVTDEDSEGRLCEEAEACPPSS